MTRLVFALTAVMTLAARGACAQSCMDASQDWQSSPFAAQTQQFQATFEATPGSARMDGLTGLSMGAPSGQDSLAAAVRFSPQGYIEVLNGGRFGADAFLPYTAGTVYRFKVSVDVPRRHYTVAAAPDGAAPKVIASNFMLGTMANSPSAVDTLSVRSQAGSHKVCGFQLATPPADTVPPMVSVLTPASGSFVAGSVTMSGTASDNVGVASVQVALDRDPPMAASGTSSWTYSLYAGALTNGPHTVTVTALDAAGNKATATVVIMVKNG